ncbi:hypothetical protein CI109_104243 [Kwoniella shandongensis]|uniref:Uncharacterized protein n=1 Tax=Kwoniella shandongensis TaxID=1734106 RepID=A0A5M6C110_9TREE|nr:uncharacterized protein CI109_002851 [Kwoniella shandongensis]KAA5528693.1 hypothetical protein CI109_002851 [Kwoniella shandongensis]
MAPVMTPQERQKWLLQQEIAKLSGAISRHSTTSQSSYHPYRGRPAPRGYSAPGARGRGRGRGRGGSYALDLRANNSKPSSAEPSRPSSSASITHPAGSSKVTGKDKEIGEVSPSPPPESNVATASTSTLTTTTTWVKGKGKTGHMSLMTSEKRAKLLTQRPRAPPQVQVLNSTTATSNGSKQVVIDGIVFQFEQDGKKLTRIGEASPSGPSTNAGGYTPTRKRLSFGGEKYRRTTRGNLVLRRNGSTRGDQPCRYFTKTGRCNFGLTCPNKHDPSRVAICARSLRGQCELGPSACPLSHTPSPHNTPSCVRFQATSTCSKPNCLYPHVKVSDDAPVCQAFARDGWCDREAGTCPDLHVWECQEYREKGTCSRKGKCGLRHVLRAEKGRAIVPEVGKEKMPTQALKEGTEAEGGFEEQTEFIEFDQGSPGIISDGEAAGSDEEEEKVEAEEEDDSDDDSDDDDDDGDGDDDDDDNDEEGESDGEYSETNLGKPAPALHDVSSDITMDTDEVDEEAVLSVVF